MTQSASVGGAEVDFSRKWSVMAAVSMGIFLATIDGSIVNIALPILVRDLNTSFATVQWVVLAYLLTIATLLLSVGRLADIRGKKTIYLTGFAVFTLGSMLCGAAPTVAWLIGLRVLQAMGAAMILALGPAIITEAFPSHERGRALGISGTVVSIGIIAGPTLGGALLGVLSWHWIFFVNVPVGVIGLWMVWRYVPMLKPRGQQRFDFLGAITLLIGLLALLTALTLGQEQGFAAPVVLALFAGFVLFLIAFIVVELRMPEPMVDLQLFRNRLFTVNLLTGLMTFVAIAGVFILLPFYLQELRGFSVQKAGYLLAVIPVALGVMAPISGSLSDRWGARLITLVGLVMLVAGYLGMSTLDANTSLMGYVLRLLPVGIGMGMFQSPNNSAILGTVPRARLGVASGLLALARTLGQTVGIAVFGAVWAARVAANSSVIITGGPTTAPIAAQIAGMEETYLAIALLLVLATLISVWVYVQERKTVEV